MGTFLNKVSFSGTVLPQMQRHSWLSQECGRTGLQCWVPGMLNIHSGRNSLHSEWASPLIHCGRGGGVPSTPTDEHCAIDWPLCMAPGLQEQEAIGEITLRSLLLKPRLINLEILGSICQASIWPKPVPQPGHPDQSPRHRQEPDPGPQANCPTRHLAASWPKQ